MGIISYFKLKIANLKLQKLNFRNLLSFTLIETIVVVGTISLALPIIFSIVFTIFQQQIKIYRLSQVKKEGDYVLNILENIIRNNVRSVHGSEPDPIEPDTNKVCINLGETFENPYLQDKNTLGTWSRFVLENNKIASHSSNPPNVNTYLTGNKVKVTSFNLSCIGKGAFSSPVINISFTITYNTTSTRPEESVSLNYQTKIKLRSY